jgi:DNA polymerase III alpha subunit (gram-positive type)
MKKLVLDTETTGLSPRYNKTLTVGLLLIDVERNFLNILDENHIFIKHDTYNANSQAMKINKIDIETHDKLAVYPEIACKQINSFVNKNSLHQTTLLGHNIGFDKGFISALFNQGEAESNLHEESEDTMHIWRSLKKKKLISPDLRSNLGTIAEFFEIDYTKAHDALADCHITAKVYKEMLRFD